MLGRPGRYALNWLGRVGRSVRSNQSNLRLSLRQAEAVRNHRVSQGINPASIPVDGKSTAQLEMPHDTEASCAKNRRVAITLRLQAVQ